MKTYKPREFAELISVSTRTLIRWEQRGYIVPYKNVSGFKFYTHNQYVDYMLSIGTPPRQIKGYREYCLDKDYLKDSGHGVNGEKPSRGRPVKDGE